MSKTTCPSETNIVLKFPRPPEGLKNNAEATSVMREVLPSARRTLAPNDQVLIKLRWIYSLSIFRDSLGVSRGDLVIEVALTELEDVVSDTRQVFGSNHALTMTFQGELERAHAEYFVQC